MTLTLRPYQQDAIDAIEAAAARGIQRPLAVMPTGTGKTVVFAHEINRRKRRTLVIAHRDELLQQAAAKIEAVIGFGQVPIGLVKAEQNNLDCPITIASVQTLSRANRLEQAAAHSFGTVVVDEAHHATAPTYMRILEAVGSFAYQGPLTLGVTATAERGDKVALGEVWQEIVFERPMLEMIEAGYLADIRAVQVQLEADFNSLHTRAGDFIDSEMEEMLLDANAPVHAVQAYQEHAPGRKGIIFTPTIKTAHAMAQAFTAANVPAEALSGETPTDERRAILARLKSGETRLVANCAVLTEGFDEPSIDLIVMARPTKSRPFFVQMLGRATRTHPGKEDAMVIDLVGSTSRHDLMTTASLFGLSPDDLEEQTVCDAIGVQREEEERREAEGRLIARTVSLFQQHKFHWVAASGNRWVLSLGTRMLVLAPDENLWNVQQIAQGQGAVLATGLDLGYAMGVAEDIARQSQVERLIDPEAAWRQHPASEKQIALLKRNRIKVRPDMTKGEAADLLTVVFANSTPRQVARSS
jgi:ATP-dependent helicase IRC3